MNERSKTLDVDVDVQQAYGLCRRSEISKYVARSPENFNTKKSKKVAKFRPINTLHHLEGVWKM